MTISPASSLYLSRLRLNPRSRQVMSEIVHPYEMHRTLMQAFPKVSAETQKKARDEFGVLFRAEFDNPAYPVEVYVQSCVEPDWTALDRFKGYLLGEVEGPKDLMPAYSNIENGQILRFRLRANPTKRISQKDHKMEGKRIELYKENDQIDWLIQKGTAEARDVPGGFNILEKKIRDEKGEIKTIPDARVCPEGKHRGLVKTSERTHKTTHAAVTFEGVLRVTDNHAFLKTIVKGIGPAKAFGFGLLSVAPAHGY